MGQKKALEEKKSYGKFDRLDGSHPFKKVLPKGFIDYPARIRRGGKLKYFNYDLAKEMGLISHDHPNQMNPELEDKILETFSIQIINEYDQMKNRSFPKDEVKAGTYMATRYLQLQHEDKKGRTSGDGRSVWNGQIKHRGKTWDVSSGGTGATRLSPATSKFNKFFETGDPSISYGCGYAELDEGVATALMSKVFNANQVKTEQTLVVIDFGNNISINVRAYQNLLRPSHFFMYLKQDDYKSLKAITDYYIDTQREKKSWENCPSNKKRYDFFIRKMNERFAKLAADFEDQYIFCWLDWDGDNILMDGGIIDYGSVRQFGLFHYEYRYDDDDRYSTNLIEQKSKAKYTIQTFLQLVDFVKNKEKKPISDFASDPILEDFEKIYEEQKNLNILHRIGFSSRRAKQLIKRHRQLVEDFRKTFAYFEKSKCDKGMQEIPDGITCDAVFSMRKFLREYPQIILVEGQWLDDSDFLEVMKSSFASEKDLEINTYRKQKIRDFQATYHELIHEVSKIFQEKEHETLMEIIKRSNIINKSARVTGDSITIIVDKILNRSKPYQTDELYELFDLITQSQNLDPDIKLNKTPQKPNQKVMQMISIIEEHREGL